jgi:uncharacterized membrane protein YfcA
MYFPVADIELSPFIPPLVAFVISFFTSMAGVSGAFLLLPFQVSILGFTSPAVSSTNHLYNVIAIPSGIYRFIKEGRMLWPLTWLVVMGTLPGVIAGVFIRINFLPSPGAFKLFVGLVLLYIGGRLFLDLVKARAPHPQREVNREDFKISHAKLTPRFLTYRFNGEDFKVGTIPVMALSLIVGLIGGVYGIGGGAIIAPFFVTIYRLPIHTVAGASLMGTFITSFVGIIFFHLFSFFSATGSEHITPDYRLGILFGLGGIVGIYLGARAQRYFSTTLIKAILTTILLFTAGKYLFFS